MTEKKNEFTNVAYIAGRLKYDPKEYDEAVRVAVDVGMSRYLMCSVDKKANGSKDLVERLLRFGKHDAVQFVCQLRPYGVKNEETGEWKNGLTIEIVEIRDAEQAPRMPVKPAPQQVRKPNGERRAPQTKTNDDDSQDLPY
jgi:hypothetical protein